MRGLIPVLLGARGWRYLGVSAVALGADMWAFVALMQAGMAAAGASALAYGLGVAVHWWLSARVVFAAADGAARRVQKLLFVGSALVGLALTVVLVGIGARAGLDPRLAKIAAVGVSFIATWLLRALVVFAPRPAAA